MFPKKKQRIKEWLESECAKAQGPFTAESVGASGFVIMCTSDPAGEQSLSEVEKANLNVGYDDRSDGKIAEADKSTVRMRD